MANEFEKSLGSTQFYDLSTYGYLGSPILDFSKQPVDNLVADDIIYSALANQSYLPSSSKSSGNGSGVSLTKNLLGVSASKLSAENYLNAIFGNERGELNSQTTLTGPNGQRATATGSYQITEGTRKGIYNNHFKSKMPYAEFDRRYRTDKRFEKEVALSLANDHIRGSKTAAEALGKWYSPKHASTGRWNVVPNPEYGNRLTVGQYVNRAAKGLKYKEGGEVINDGKTGMMKGKIAMAAHFGNPAAVRMTKPITEPYVFDGTEMWNGKPVNAKGQTGTHFMGSFGKQARPSIQEIDGKLQYIENPSGDSKENMQFDSEADAEYFAEHYKDVAPMMKFNNGGMVSAKQQLISKILQK